MLTLSADKREAKKTKEKGSLPAVLYGPKKKSESIAINLKKFKEIFAKVGESSLISLEIGKEKMPVLIHDIQQDSITGEPIHVDFYQPILTNEVEVSVPIIFEGVSLAVKDLGGTLVKEIQEIKVKALPHNLPHEIRVDISALKSFEDEILVKDLNLPGDVRVSRHLDEIVALVVPPAKIEEELAKPIEEKVEEVGKVETKKKEEEIVEEVKEQKTDKADKK
jgi:large subunit ribosomal protein L25